jgi:hypothetical protein
MALPQSRLGTEDLSQASSRGEIGERREYGYGVLLTPLYPWENFLVLCRPAHWADKKEVYSIRASWSSTTVASTVWSANPLAAGMMLCKGATAWALSSRDL